MVTARTRRFAERIALYGIALALLLAAFGTARAAWQLYNKMAALAESRHDAERSLEELGARSVELSALVEELETERGIEAEIRSRYPLVKQGEVAFIILDTPATSTEEAPKEASWWERFKRLLPF